MKYESSKADKAADKKLRLKEGSRLDVDIRNNKGMKVIVRKVKKGKR